MPKTSAPSDLTIGECIAKGYSVTIWCTTHPCPGRDLELSKLGRFADRGLVELAEAGKFKCAACGAPAGFISVSAHLVTEKVFQWRRPAPQPFGVKAPGPGPA